MNRIIVNVLSNTILSTSVYLITIEKEVVAIKGSISALEGVNTDLRKENQALKEEVKVLVD